MIDIRLRQPPVHQLTPLLTLQPGHRRRRPCQRFRRRLLQPREKIGDGRGRSVEVDGLEEVGCLICGIRQLICGIRTISRIQPPKGGPHDWGGRQHSDRWYSARLA